MKYLLKSLMLLAVVVLAACSEKEYSSQSGQLEVTRNNIAGEWQLSLWNGAPLAEGSYLYIDFERSDRTYTLWQNIDSAPVRVLTGLYNIDVDEELGAIIRGSYDYGNGFWAHRYIVKSLTANEMVWVAKDDPEDVSLYVRTQIPEEIRGEE